MSTHSIHEYQNEVEKIIDFGGTKKETAIRSAFLNLLNEYAKQKGLMIVTEVTIKATNSNKNVTPDGTLKDVLRQDWGYWESKDESDNLDDEIKKKFEKGYPKENILFEDSKTAVLIQNGIEIMRVPFSDAEKLHRLLNAFISFERPEVTHFRKAIEHFKEDIPKVTETIRSIIIEAEKTNIKYIKAAEVFLKLCHDSINPNITIDDVREMIIQHILTEDIFNTIFDETQFHRENNIARELETVINTFFTGNTRRVALSSVQHYYQAINAAAATIADHHEKQKFLKVVYETFYKSYNPKAADRLGVVYTPNEIVRFMIESTDYLLHKHFNKYLEDKNVEILDPATGTGTFICDLIDYLRKEKVEYKYKNEIHANEVAILPYYISNLNIEFTYTQKTGKYSEFENLCFVDTLDNMGFAFRGKQIDMFAPFTEENSKRIKKQNDKKIAVIIGNPPYNANQANENDNNKNREYPEIDKRIKDTFI
jgi:predicted helicase